MSKLERYSLHSGLKVSKPFINDCYFPTTIDKYISFNTSSLVQSKHYDLWQEVIDFIKPYLKSKNVEIIQIGSSKDPVIEGVFNYKGVTNFNQSAFLIKNSLLHFNVCDHFSYVAHIFSTPLVCLFSNEPSSSFSLKPNEKTLFIDSPKDQGCSYSLLENPKTINKINPAEISSKILKLLGIKNDLNNIDLLYSGESSHIKIIEVVPDFEPKVDFLKNSLINIRMDYFFDEVNLFKFCQNRKLGLITDKPLSENVLSACRNSLAKVSIDISEIDFAEATKFLKNLKKFNIVYDLFTFKESLLSKLRLDFFDEKITLFEKKTKKDLDIKLSDSYDYDVKSSKILISNAQAFPSKAHWIVGQESNGQFNSIIDTSDFWEDIDYYIIYRKDKNAKGKTKRK